MLALCREHRVEHRTKHIALRYFLARELQQRGQLRLAYVASQANTADIFTKALQPCDHQRFCTMLACFALLCLSGLFYHPTSRQVLPSQNITFDESVPFYRLFPYRTAPLPPPPLFLAPGPPPIDPLPPQCPAPSGVSQVDAVEPVEVAVDTGAAGGVERACAEPVGAEPGGAELERAEPGGAEPERVGSGGAESGGVEPAVAKTGGAESAGGPAGASSRREPLSPQQLREWFACYWRRIGAAKAGGSAGFGAVAAGAVHARGAAGAGASGTAGVGARGAAGAGASGAAGVGAGGAGAIPSGGVAAAGASGAAGVGAEGDGAVPAGGATGTGASGAAGVGAGDLGAGGTGGASAGSGGAARPRPYFVPLLQQVLGLPPSTSPTPLLEYPPPVQSQSQLQPDSPLPAPSPYAGPTGGLAERREPASRPASPVPAVRTGRRVPPPQRVPLPSPLASSLADGPDPESDSLRATSPTVTRLLATVVTEPSFESTAASALVAWRTWGSCLEDGLELSSLVMQTLLGSSCEAEIYAGAMAAQELLWLTYLLTDLGEAPRSPPVLYVDNKAMIALCQEHRLEHRMKHIALRYFLARELQQRGQLRLAYVATRANTTDIFTKALLPCDHQRFCTVLGLVPTWPQLLTS
ncbi:unnamed protein product [Closterium sp. NIES-53]